MELQHLSVILDLNCSCYYFTAPNFQEALDGLKPIIETILKQETEEGSA